MDVAKVLGTWGRPPDVVAWCALGAGAFFVLEIASKPKPGDRPTPRATFLGAAAFAAAFLSLGYVAHYLRGGPRIIDATSYFLQGRALSHGHFAWPVPDPSASFRGRFLLFAEPDRLAGIFPPGYPLLLALFFALGAPMLAGPALAAALAVATHALAHEVVRALPPERARSLDAEALARASALLSVLCAALRNHTADTRSHGASALGVTLALCLALRARRTESARLFAAAGMAAGYVLATRVASALPIAGACAFVAWQSRARGRAFAALAAGAVPGLALLLGAQLAATGHLLASTQRAYYAASDGPPGCFRYGFGAGTGCVGEHGDFVRDRLAGGFGLVEALGTTLRRLKLHAMDVANFEPLALLALAPLRRGAAAVERLALAIVGGQVLAYAPFYFDGNYPGGGGRMLADVLPVEHVLVVLGAATLAPHVPWRARAGIVLAASCVGFAVHASHDHVSFANRDGGRPMFEPDVLHHAAVTSGLVLVDTDHGFNLGHDPGASASGAVVVARARGDDHDRLLHDRLGHPPAHLYKRGDGPSQLAPFVATGTEDLWTFEAEADWPALAQTGGYALAEYLPGCAPRALTLTPAPRGGRATATLALPVPREGSWAVSPRVVALDPDARGAVYVLPSADAPASAARAAWRFAGRPAECLELEAQTVRLRGASAHLLVEAEGGRVALDRTTLRAAP